MDRLNSAVVDVVSLPDGVPPPQRQYRSAELKRQIVEATFARGASVARVARSYGVNANQVYAWRRQYERGRLPRLAPGTPGLLAVQVGEGGEESKRRPISWAGLGVIQVELPKGHLRLTGCVEGETLRVVREALRS
jgi:transposase